MDPTRCERCQCYVSQHPMKFSDGQECIDGTGEPLRSTDWSAPSVSSSAPTPTWDEMASMFPDNTKRANRPRGSSAEPAPPTGRVETWQTSEGRAVTVLPSFHKGKQLTVVMFPDDGAAMADKALAASENGPVTLIGAPSLTLHQLRLRVARDPSLASKIAVLALVDGTHYREIDLGDGGVMRWPVGFEKEALDIEMAIIKVYHDRKTAATEEPRT